MSEAMRRMGAIVGIAILGALGVGILAVSLFPVNPAGPSAVSSNTTHGGVGGVPKPLAGYVYAQSISCFLDTGTCSFTIENNSNVTVKLVGCFMPYSNRINGSGQMDGTIGRSTTATGKESSWLIPGKTTFGATCTIPTSYLSGEIPGSLVLDGGFEVALVDPINYTWGTVPAGTLVGYSFLESNQAPHWIGSPQNSTSTLSTTMP